MRTRPRSCALALVAALATTALLHAPPATAGTTATRGASSAPVVDAGPRGLPRGADVALPHLDGTTIVDGAVRIPVRGDRVRLLGRSGTSYVVTATRGERTRGRVLRYAADGSAQLLTRAETYDAELSDDGTTVVTTRIKLRGKTRTEVTAVDAVTGARVGRVVLPGYASTLDVDAGTVVLGSYEPRAGTRLWTLATGTVSLLSRRIGMAADLRHDLLAAYSKDPYEGGCTVVSRLSDPAVRLWRSCDERVEQFSTDGSHMALVDVLSDGIGPGAVRVRSTTGALVATYAAKLYFGVLRFESPTTLLLESYLQRTGAIVRCDGTACERASGYVREYWKGLGL